MTTFHVARLLLIHFEETKAFEFVNSRALINNKSWGNLAGRINKKIICKLTANCMVVFDVDVWSPNWFWARLTALDAGLVDCCVGPTAGILIVPLVLLALCSTYYV